jgi:hypothetical protein
LPTSLIRRIAELRIAETSGAMLTAHDLAGNWSTAAKAKLP